MERANCKEKIIVSLTSWKNRVRSNITRTIFSILDGTVRPDAVYLTLSEREWSNRTEAEYEALEDIIKISNVYENFHILMVDGPDTKCFKKLIPVMEMHKDENCIYITVDDDIIYPENFVELMVKKHREDESRPVTASYFQRNGMLFMWGGAALYRYEHIRGYENLLDDEIISTYEDDWFFTYVLLYNCVKPMLAPEEIYYSPSTYIQAIHDDQMYRNGGYDSIRTENILNGKLESLGTSFDALCDAVFEKYGNSL